MTEVIQKFTLRCKVLKLHLRIFCMKPLASPPCSSYKELLYYSMVTSTKAPASGLHFRQNELVQLWCTDQRIDIKTVSCCHDWSKRTVAIPYCVLMDTAHCRTATQYIHLVMCIHPGINIILQQEDGSTPTHIRFVSGLLCHSLLSHSDLANCQLKCNEESMTTTLCHVDMQNNIIQVRCIVAYVIQSLRWSQSTNREVQTSFITKTIPGQGEGCSI